MFIERKLIASPLVVIYSKISWMQQWRPLLSTKEQELMQIICRRIKKVVGKLSLRKSRQVKRGIG
jgi:hypothetical protein